MRILPLRHDSHFLVMVRKSLYDGRRLYTPLALGETEVVVVAPLCVGLGCGEKLGSFGRILLHDGSVAHLAFEEVLELASVGSLRVEREGVLALFLQSGIVAPEVPVAALHCMLLLGLALAHAHFQAMVDTG